MALGFVKVPVPVDRLQEVYALLALSRSDEHGPRAPAVETSVGVPSIDAETIARAYRESSDAMKKALDHMAENADRVIRMEELAGSVGYSAAQMRGTLGSFGNRWRNRYRGSEDDMPFTRWWVAEDNTMVYRMTGDIAVLIIKTRDS